MQQKTSVCTIKFDVSYDYVYYLLNLPFEFIFLFWW